MRVVVDTSTIIKGLLRRFTEPSYIVDRILDGTYRLIMTEEMAKELMVATYAIAVKHNADYKKHLRSLGIITLNAYRIKTTTVFTSCSDPEDSMFIECAIDGEASYCISSDRSLFNLQNYCKDKDELELISGIEFYNPEDFYNIVVNPAHR